jgi:hypothetical protein
MAAAASLIAFLAPAISSASRIKVAWRPGIKGQGQRSVVGTDPGAAPPPPYHRESPESNDPVETVLTESGRNTGVDPPQPGEPTPAPASR